VRQRLGAICLLTITLFLAPQSGLAQVRGVYPLGMSATNSGVTGEPGLSYSNFFLFYARDELKGPDGEVQATGLNTVLMDMNTLIWASGKELVLGARYSIAVTLPIANNSLSSDSGGALSGGGGLADSYYQPLILGWRMARLDIKAAYGFLAPTGKFEASASDNVGSGYWTHAFSSGQTLYFSPAKQTSLSAFEMYEVHTQQEDTAIQPGDTFDLDYSVTHTFASDEDLNVQVGIIGYAQWQTTDKAGPAITPAEASAHYQVYALGLATNFVLLARKVTLGLKYFDEFSNKSTFEGYSIQISGAVKF
jgi:hypothetical protein